MNHRPRKRFGQNFLRDRQVIDAIVASLDLQRDDRVVEIGPGEAALTDPLLARLDALTVIEIDRDLAGALLARGDTRLDVLCQDVLDTDFGALAATAGTRLRIVGNLPYNISTPLLLRLARAHAAVRDAHVMLQQEVVDRIVAPGGTRHFGRLAVMLQSVFDTTRLLTVPPSAFVPPPKVQSAVIRLRVRADAPDMATLDRLERAARLAFANRRKTLRNNFRGQLDDAAFAALDIDPSARAETLSLPDFHRLGAALTA